MHKKKMDEDGWKDEYGCMGYPVSRGFFLVPPLGK
jgi:hypothetical protein